MKLSRYVLAGILSGVLGHSQVPEILTISPSAARAGDSVAIRGQDFDPVATNNVVYFGNVRARVLGGTVAELRVDLPRGVQAGPVTVTTAGLTTESPTPFLPLFAPFGPETNVSYASRPMPGPTLTMGTTADLDGDGDAELLAVAPRGIDVYEYRSTGPLITTNSFIWRSRLSIGGLPNAIIIPTDVDSDGRLDIVVTSPEGGGLNLFRNIHTGEALGTNSFEPAIREGFIVPPSAFHFADFDRDGHVDLATIDSGGLSVYKISYEPGVTNRLLGPRLLLGPRRTLIDLAAADLNRDGTVDLLVVTPTEISIYSHNSRRGTFTTNAFSRVVLNVTNVAAIEVGDIEGDGFPDILTFNRSSEFSVLWNQCEGRSLRAEDFRGVRLNIVSRFNAFPSAPPLLADVNGDALPDIIAGPQYLAINQSGVVKDLIFSGTFAAVSNRLLIAFNSRIVLGDINGDGAVDLGAGAVLLQNVSELPTQLIGISQRRNGPVQLRFQGRPMEVLPLESSVDLSLWGPDQSVPRVGTTGELVLDLPWTNYRFYRLKSSERE